MLVAGMALMSVVAVCVAVTRLQTQGGRQEVCSLRESLHDNDICSSISKIWPYVLTLP